MRRYRAGAAGFSVIEVAIAMAISAVAMLATLKLIQYSARTNRSVAVSSDFNNLVSAIALVLAYPDSCAKSTLIGASFPGSLPMDLPEIKLPSGPVVKVGLYEPGLRITALRFTEELDEIPLPSGLRQKILNLRLEAEKESYAHVGRKQLASDFKMFLTLDAAARIVDCGGTARGASVADVCAAMGAAYDPATGLCNLEKFVCDRTGGVWLTATRSCDRSGSNYASVTPGGPAYSTQTALCRTGDVASGGGVETRNPGDISRSYPILSGGKAVGWSCNGQNIQNCYVLCRKDL